MRPEADPVVYGWQQGSVGPALTVTRAQDVWLWDCAGRRYLDLCAGQMNVNIGHSHPHVLRAMTQQMERLIYVAPSFATEARTRLAAQIIERAPSPLQHVFFTSTGSEAIEVAIKVARAVTGRNKIYSAWRSYHGATAAASGVSGDPRRLFVEPGIPGLRHFHGATCHQCAFGLSSPPECGLVCARSLKNSVLLDGPETVAAILIEPIPGTSGVYVPPKQFLVEIQSFCAEHGFLLIVDETMTGWGRTGRWFASEHFELQPDIMTTAKGITSAYVPLGAVIMSGKVRKHFDARPFVAGSTNEGHALACVAGIANIEVYEGERLIERSASLGLHLAQRLNALRARHPSIGDVRSLGLFGCIELTGGPRSSEPLAGYRDQYGNVSKELTRRLLDLGVALVAKWDYLFIAPPLTITQEALDEGLDALDVALEIADERVIQRRGTTEAAAGAGR